MRPSGAALDAKTQVETAFRRVTRPRSSHSGPLTASSGLPAQHPAPLQSRDLKPVHSWMGPRFRDLGHLVRRTRRTMPGSVPRPAGLAPRPLPDSHRACRTRTAPAGLAPRLPNPHLALPEQTLGMSRWTLPEPSRVASPSEGQAIGHRLQPCRPPHVSAANPGTLACSVGTGGRARQSAWPHRPRIHGEKPGNQDAGPPS